MTLNTRPISTSNFAARQRFPRLTSQGESLTPISSSSTGSISPVLSPSISPSTSTVRVLVAGNHATLRSCLKTMLELDPQISVVGEATDDCELLKMANRVRPDVVLVDIDMHCCDDYDALMEITQQNLATSVIALTIHGGEADRAAAEKAGVNLFLEKGIPYKQLINAVRSAADCNSKP
jgi:SARP family transcriptional regulator, regulator of embCAB operon